MSKNLPRNPSFIPCASLRENLESRKEGTSERINQIWERYRYLQSEKPIELSLDEIQVVMNICCGSIVDTIFIQCLDHEVYDSDDYNEECEAAISLYEKLKSTTYSQRLALIEKLGF
jgi:hypothetical protein